MAVTVAQYLATPYEREPEFVHGQLLERSWPTFSHGSVQLGLGSRLHAIARAHGQRCALGVRLCLSADLYRIPDIALWTGPETPLLVVEICSPEDRLHDLLQKLEEYRAWGVEHIWLVEPELKQFHIYDHGSLREVGQLELPQFGFQVTTAELFQ